MTLREQVDQAFRVLEERDTSTGSVQWFHGRLEAAGVTVTKQAVATWLRNDRVPDKRVADVHRVLFGLHARATEVLVREFEAQAREMTAEVKDAVAAMKAMDEAMAKLETLEDGDDE